jgi:SAM-dependent methyltransferase
MVNVLEHIEDDGAALTGIRAVLRPGGRLLIFVPAMSWLMSDFDRLVGHFRRYHKRPLVELIKGAGFEVQSARYCDILGVLPWLVLNRFLGSTSLNPTLAQIYDRVGTPVTRALELLFTPPLGKNVILVARKPAGRASGQEQQGSSALAGQ